MKLSPLDQLNAIVGLSKRIEGWPSTLLDLGYSLDRIELKLKIPDKTRPGVSIEVVPDILFVAGTRNFSLIVELKSGRLQDFKQLDKLIHLSPEELVVYGRVSLQNAASDRHQISVTAVINHEFLSEYLDEFQRVNHEACLTSIGSKFIKAHHGKFKDPKANKSFHEGIPIDGAYRPTRLIKVLPTTDDKKALSNSVVNALKESWINNEHSITPQIIASKVFRQLWGAFDKWAQDSYLVFAKNALTDMQHTEFNKYMRPVPGESAEWKLLSLPEAMEQRYRSRALQGFQKSLSDYKWRTSQGKPYPKKLAAQPSFYDIEGVVPNSEEDD